ncbi:hypothetical protein [Naasia aerilata]|uniref:hypothetical protein n=1 Tax=Naasia aerilata TaxID=1162966 RepID=UPI003305A9EF
MNPGSAGEFRHWSAGDVVELNLPLAARITHPDARIDALRGQVAVERGPIVYCLESTDLAEGGSVNSVQLAEPRVDEDSGDLTVELSELRPSGEQGWPYGAPDTPPGSQTTEPARVRLVPYSRWGNRGPSTMRVWIPLRAAAGKEGANERGSTR